MAVISANHITSLPSTSLLMHQGIEHIHHQSILPGVCSVGKEVDYIIALSTTWATTCCGVDQFSKVASAGSSSGLLATAL